MKEFLRTGRFGPIELGATQEQIEKAFGPPDAKGGSPRKQRDLIWKYGAIELHFHPRLRVLFLIHADHFEALAGAGGLELDPWLLSGTLHRKGAQHYLDRADISYQIRPHPHEPNTDELRTCGNVFLLFGGEDEANAEERHLIAISRGGARRQA